MNARRIASLAIIAAVLFRGGSLPAGIIEDFRFNEADGTVITDTVNSVPGGHTWLSENTVVNSSVQNSAFRIQKTSPTTQVGNTLDIADVTTGKIWLVARLDGWSYTATASSPSERVRFAFLDNATPTAGSNTITAEMNLDRSGSNLTVSGDAGGTGSTATIAGTASLALTRDIPLWMFLEVDADADKYSVYYKDGTNPTTLVGIGDLGIRSGTTIREPRSVRFAFTGTYDSANGEFVDVARIWVTDMNPIPEPASMALAGLAAVLLFGWRRRAS